MSNVKRIEIKVKGAYQDEFNTIKERTEELLGTQVLSLLSESNNRIIITDPNVSTATVFTVVKKLKKENKDIFLEVYAVSGRGSDKEVDLLKAV